MLPRRRMSLRALCAGCALHCMTRGMRDSWTEFELTARDDPARLNVCRFHTHINVTCIKKCSCSICGRRKSACDCPECAVSRR